MKSEVSYRHNPSKKPRLYTTSCDLLRQSAEQFPIKTALVVRKANGRDSITYGELFQKATHFSKVLVNHGVKTGDLVALFVTNSVEWMIANFGISLAGAASLNTFTFMQDKDFQWILKFNCTALVVDFRVSHVFDEMVQKTTNISDRGTAMKQNFPVIYIAPHSVLDRPEWISFTAALEQPQAKDCELPTVDPESSCFVFQSSGSTGKPKLIVHKHSNLMNNGDVMASLLGLTSNDVFWSPRPLGYGAGFPLFMITRGLTFVTVDNSLIQGGVALSNITERILHEEQVNSGYIAPYFVFDLQRSGSRMPDNFFKSIITSGQRISAETMLAMKKISRKAAQGYGTTETMWGSFFEVTAGTEHEDDLMGDLLPGIEAKIVNDHGCIVPVGECGELYIKSPYMLSHYLASDGSFKSALDGNGWFPTGDMACFTDNGKTYIKGRTVEMIKKCGLRIFPASIETELLKHPAIEQAVVVGVDDDRMYEDIAAVVTLKSGCTVTETELQTYAQGVFRPHLIVRSGNLMPSYFFIEDQLPTLQSGKINRRAVKQFANTKVNGLS